MNLFSKFSTAFFALGASALMVGCDAMFHDELGDCPQGVYVKLYQQTPCEDVPSYLGNVEQLHLFAFDQENRLAGIHEAKNVTIGQNDSILMPLSGGNYSFIAWAGASEPAVISKFTVGETLKKDVLLLLPTTASNVLPELGGKKILQGETYENVELPSAVTDGSVYKTTSINVANKVYRINFIIKIDPNAEEALTPQDFKLSVRSAGTAMSYDATMPLGRPSANYPLTVSYESNKQKATVNMLDIRHTGYDNRVILTNTKTGKELWNADLLGTVLLNRLTNEMNPNLNLNCQNEVNVEFLIKDKCKDCQDYVCYEIRVADWVVHSYSSVLGL